MPLQAWPLAALSVLAGGAAYRLSIPTGWLFGPLLLGAGLTSTGHALSSPPAWLVNLGQWLIACSLGSRFTPDFFRGAPRFLLGVLASGCALILLGLGSASAVA